jgi:hypothetical protein
MFSYPPSPISLASDKELDSSEVPLLSCLLVSKLCNYKCHGMLGKPFEHRLLECLNTYITLMSVQTINGK